MATNYGRLWMSLSLAALAACPLPAVAEIPRSTAEWLAVYRERQARFDAVEIESHWQRLEGEKVVEEWDQKFYADDLGRLRLEARGRLRRDTRRDGVGILSDAIYAFDGGEYRELEKRWEYSLHRGIAPEAIAAALRTTPRAAQGRIEAEAGDHSAIRQAETPLKWADYWFLICATNAAKEQLEPRVSPVDGRPGVWEVAFESKLPEWGHTCRAWVVPGQDNHVTRIDLRSQGQWSGRYDVSYSKRNGRWLPANGSYAQLSPPVVQAGQQHAMSLRFTTQEANVGERLTEQGFLPAFPVGAWVADLRTKAAYRLGREDESDQRMDRLVTKARQEHASLLAARDEHARWPARLARTAKYGAAGMVTGLVLSSLWSTAARRFSGRLERSRRAPRAVTRV